MELLEIMGVMLTLAALLAWVNARFLRLPATVGLMALSLVLAFALMVMHVLLPGVPYYLENLVAGIDFELVLLQGMLGYLLFAGAIHVNLDDLQATRRSRSRCWRHWASRRRCSWRAG